MKTWFITGTSKGFGRIWAEAALARGDKVAATARDTTTLDPLVEKYGDNIFPIKLDVSNKDDSFAAVGSAKEHFGQLDIVINNAGYGHFGAIEELSEKDIRDQLDTNFFGALWITQAAIPIMREQGSGHIIQVTSIGGVRAFPGIGAYHASKWALEGLTQALSQEVKGLGIDVTLIEPAGYSTDWGTASASHSETISVYDPLREARAEMQKNPTVPQGDPDATASVVLELVDMDEPPLRLFLGKYLNQSIHEEYDKRLAEWDKYDELSARAQG